MKKYFSSAICATAILLGGVSVDAVLAPASAQYYSVDFYTFHDALAPYGDWVYSDRWGEVWIPTDVPYDFRPYDTAGYWAYTDDYGWVWDSDFEWGDIPFHYGRWVNDPEDGWLWIPGYVWGPGWVVWRSNYRYTGWMPMPPDDDFINGGGPSFGISFGGRGFHFSINFNDTRDYYGYSRWYGRDYDERRFADNWVFVGTGHISDRDFRRYEAPRNNYTTFIQNTTNITNYTVVNNYVVNRSVDVRSYERASGHPVERFAVQDVVRQPQLITHADTGRDIQTRMRQELPRGNGFVGSAPKPPPQVIETLSTKVAPRNGGNPPAHLFTRDTVVRAPLAPATPQNGFAPMGRRGNDTGMPSNGPSSGPGMNGPATTGPGMTGPGSEGFGGTRRRHDFQAPTSNGMPSNGLPTNGAPTNGAPSNGTPSNGNPTNRFSPNGPFGPNPNSSGMSGPGTTGPEGQGLSPRHHGQQNPMSSGPNGPGMGGPTTNGPDNTTGPGNPPPNGFRERRSPNPFNGPASNGPDNSSGPGNPPVNGFRERRNPNSFNGPAMNGPSPDNSMGAPANNFRERHNPNPFSGPNPDTGPTTPPSNPEPMRRERTPFTPMGGPSGASGGGSSPPPSFGRPERVAPANVAPDNPPPPPPKDDKKPKHDDPNKPQ